MRQHTRPRAAHLFLVFGLAGLAGAAACGGSISPTPLVPTVPTISTLPSDAEMLSEKTQGNASARNTIIEYVSFWDGSSRTFYLTGDGVQIKSQLADTGKAQVQFRNLFLGVELSTNSQLPVAAMLARCAGNARFFDAVTTIFQNQATWMSANDPDAAVKSVMLGFGMGQSVINACVADTNLANGLGQVATNALQANYQLPDGTPRTTTTSSTGRSIQRVPAVIVNGTTIFDGMDNAGNANSSFAPTLANIQPFLK